MWCLHSKPKAPSLIPSTRPKKKREKKEKKLYNRVETIYTPNINSQNLTKILHSVTKFGKF